MHVDVVLPWEVSLQSARVWKNNYSRNETVSCGYLEISYHIDAKRYRVAGYLIYTDANVAAKWMLCSFFMIDNDRPWNKILQT